jgi:hypothetical protein
VPKSSKSIQKLKSLSFISCTLSLQVRSALWNLSRSLGVLILDFALGPILHFMMSAIARWCQQFKPVASPTGTSTSQNPWLTFINMVFTIPHFMNEEIA